MQIKTIEDFHAAELAVADLIILLKKCGLNIERLEDRSEQERRIRLLVEMIACGGEPGDKPVWLSNEVLKQASECIGARILSMQPSISDAALINGPGSNCPGLQGLNIEPGILPVCVALNEKHNVLTLWSCEGHPDRSTEPYVSFVAPQRVAFKLDQLLENGRADGRLTYCWWIQASFGKDGSFVYTLRPNDSRLSEPRFIWWPGSRPWNRTDMDAELLRLAEMIADMDNVEIHDKSSHCQPNSRGAAGRAGFQPTSHH